MDVGLGSSAVRRNTSRRISPLRERTAMTSSAASNRSTRFCPIQSMSSPFGEYRGISFCIREDTSGVKGCGRWINERPGAHMDMGKVRRKVRVALAYELGLYLLYTPRGADL
jgi:hypothetical protein